jgi:hypothetical protein
MGLREEYLQTKELVLSLNFDKLDEYVNYFETNIRGLGGLLTMYDLDGDKRYLEKAVD